MGSEIFDLKSLYFDDSVVRGTRINIKNAETTKTIQVNPDDPTAVKTGETGVNTEYLIQSSLKGNDLKGYGTFTNNSSVVTGYTGAQDLKNSDLIRKDGDQSFYTVTGIEGDRVYLESRYIKEETSDPSVQEGVASIRKVKIGSAEYEHISSSEEDAFISYDKNETDWGVTGLQMEGPEVTSSDPVQLDTGVKIKFLPGASKNAADLFTVGSVYKTLISNNRSPVTDVALSPMPYPHESLQVWIGTEESGVTKREEFVDYVVNYSQSPELKYPRPPFEEREVAYLKFLGEIIDETQVSEIDSQFQGRFTVSRPSEEGVDLRVPINDIIPEKGFEVKVAGESQKENVDYIGNYEAGIVAFVDHRNAEELVDTILYPKNLIWNGISLIKGVKLEDVIDEENLVIPGFSGLEGIDHTVYFEDTDQNNLTRDTDYIIDENSGAISFTQPLQQNEAVLVSYYVEGQDAESEDVLLDDLRLNKYPIIVGTVSLRLRFVETDEDGNEITKTTILVEGSDFDLSYVTGIITLKSVPSNARILKLQATYTPMAQIHCILQPVEGEDLNFRMTIVDDILEIIETEKLVFKVNNPAVSTPRKILFSSEITDSNYNFENTIGKIYSISERGGSQTYDPTGYKYTDSDRLLELDQKNNEDRPEKEDTIVASYMFQSEVLPYAPFLLISPIFESGSDSFTIEGFDRRDVLKKGMVLKIDNFDPENSYYFKIKDISYEEPNTKVSLYGTFPEDVQQPTFNLLDDGIVWQDLSSDVVADTEVAVGSETIILQGNMLFVRNNLSSNVILEIQGTDIYQITSVTIEDDRAFVGIFPALRRNMSSAIRFSRRPVFTNGDTLLEPERPIVEDPEQPAFMLRYEAPTGYEGSVKILIDEEKIQLRESIGGVPNPIPYIFNFSDYADIRSLAKGIQGTVSTYRDNVPDTDVPSYNPFTIVSEEGDRELYYLGDGSWTTDSIIPFENADEQDLPYTVTVGSELYRYTLLELFKDQSQFTVKETDKTGLFSAGKLVAFKDKISGVTFYHEITGSELVDGSGSLKDTKVSLKDQIKINMLDPQTYYHSAVTWLVIENTLGNVDRDNSTLTFAGSPAHNLVPGTILTIRDSEIYYVEQVTTGASGFTVRVSPGLSSSVTLESYYGYVKQSKYPSYFAGEGTQPYFYINYEDPYGHVGSAEIKIEREKVTLKETVDNFSTKETELSFGDYNNYEGFFEAINDVESFVSGSRPFSVSLSSQFESVLKDKFETYKAQTYSGDYVSLPRNINLAKQVSEVTYTSPSGYEGSAQIKVSADSIEIKEIIKDYQNGEDGEKRTLLKYSDVTTFFDLVTIINEITSLVSSSVFPFSATTENASFISRGTWDFVSINPQGDEFFDLPGALHAVITTSVWQQINRLNLRKLDLDSDYQIETGAVSLSSGLQRLERYILNYMGSGDLSEQAGESITCSCRYFASLPVGSKLDVYLDYLNIDQFYIQKLTERKFTEIVVVPQIQELLRQKGGSGAQGTDSGANNDEVPNWEGGFADLYYRFRDELIKKQLYVRFYEWYKDRLRNFSAELQLTLGFKFAHSTAVGLSNGQYSLEDSVVENQDYTLTSDEDLDQINNGFSKFFPVGYQDRAPKYYDRFYDEYLAYNDVYCCNIRTKDEEGNISTKGYIKSKSPYWKMDQDYDVWPDDYIEKNLVGYYETDVPEADRTFDAATYTFLKTVEEGDEVKIEGFDNYYEIEAIKSDASDGYEYIRLSKSFSERTLRTFDQVNMKDKDGDAVSFNKLMDNLPDEGYNIFVKRSEAQSFPMQDDRGTLGAVAYGSRIEGHITNTRRIKKPSFELLLTILLGPLGEAVQRTKKFRVRAKKDSEAPWETVEEIDLSKLDFKEERNVDDVLDALRYGFKKIATLPPLDFYRIDERQSEGLHRFFYITFEKIYDADSPSGYFEAIVFRAKDRNWEFLIDDGGEQPIVKDYGFNPSDTYKNFYDPDNIYKRLLLEKQAWELEEMILQDLFDHSDKIARAFDQGDLNRANSKFQGYLAKPVGSEDDGVSDILTVRIPAYEKQLAFLINSQGPVNKVLKPDGVHDEDDASVQIAKSYERSSEALSLYSDFYARLQFYKTLNHDNNLQWRNDYVKWVLGLREGLIYQRDARDMYENNTRVLTIGLDEVPAVNISLVSDSLYSVSNAVYSIRSRYQGKYLVLSFGLSSGSGDLGTISVSFDLYKTVSVGGIDSVVYKSLTEFASDISSYRYGGRQLFAAEKIFEHFENNVTRLAVLSESIPVDASSGAIVYVSTVEDHRGKDPRVLYLNRNIEDRVYTHNIRELPGLEFTYNGNYYTHSEEDLAVSITASTLQVALFEFKVDLDEDFNKVLYTKVTFVNGNIQYFTFPLYSPSLGRYLTLSELVEELNSFNYLGSSVFSAAVEYTGTQGGDLSCSYMVAFSDYTRAEFEINQVKAELFARVTEQLDNIPENLNQGIYRIYYDTDFHKKLEIKFESVIVDGSIIRSNPDGTPVVFTFDFQKEDDSFKTLSEFATEVSSLLYRNFSIFSMRSIYEGDTGSGLLCRYVVADNIERDIGFDFSENIYVDTYVESIDLDSSSDRDVSQVKNALFSFPMYTANGNPNKTPIEDIPVAGTWENTSAENVIQLQCIDGEEWTVTYSDFAEGDYKDYMAPPEILAQIDSTGAITEEQYQSIRTVQDQPSITLLKELVLIRKGAEQDVTLRINLRQHSTITGLISAINAARFNDAGEEDPTGDIQYFSATLVGDPDIQGTYKSYELSAEYLPVVRSFDVTGGEFRQNQLIGWKITEVDLTSDQSYTLRMSEKRYSHGQTYTFTAKEPEEAYIDTLENNPQGFTRDILAFDIYSWDVNAHYTIKDDWIYFRSGNVDYSSVADIGQPDKTLGHGIPLAGSGHEIVSPRESIGTLVARINSDSLVNKWFYANLKFTREDVDDPGFFEYNYLPNLDADVPQSTRDELKLKDDTAIIFGPNDGYTFDTSSYTVSNAFKALDLACDWRFSYQYEAVYNFASPDANTIGELVSEINSGTSPNIAASIFEAAVVGIHTGTDSTELFSTGGAQSISDTAIDLNVQGVSAPEPAMTLKVRSLTGANFTITDATYQVPSTQDRLVVRCTVTYNDSFSVTGHDYSSETLEELSDYIGDLTGYSDPIFPPLFSSSLQHSSYGVREATRLIDATGTVEASTELVASFDDVTAMFLLNMSPEANVTVEPTRILAVSYDTYQADFPADRDLHTWIDDVIKGDVQSGLLSLDILPIKRESVPYGWIAEGQIDLSVNEAAHVYFGMMGDIKWLQVSDYGLYVQLNYVKERLGKPWKDDQGIVRPDYYTPETYNANNPLAIDLDNFLGYLRTVRYNQIKDSIVDEALVQNKYFWLYMKFHREFGCDQQVVSLQKELESREEDAEIIDQIN